MKSNLALIVCLLLATAFNCLAQAPAFILPLASSARATPAKFPEEIDKERHSALNTKYSVILGEHEFDTLEKDAAMLMERYRNHQISGKEFYEGMSDMVPYRGGLLQVPDVEAWTHDKPESYAAWYILARLYVTIAFDARGRKWANETAKEQFEEAHKYAERSRQAALRSLSLYSRPTPSYRTLILVDALSDSRQQKTSGMILKDQVCAFAGEHFPKIYAIACNTDPDTNPELEYLKASLSLDPDTDIVYDYYLFYNSRRWGGSDEEGERIVAQAKASGKMSAANLAEIEAKLIEQQASDAEDLDNDPARAAKLYIKSYEVAPLPENNYMLYRGAKAARRVHNPDLALDIYSRIIQSRPGEHKAYFERGIVYMQDKHDIARYFADQIESAKLGDMYAQNNVGYFYLTGYKGFPIDLDQARAWLTLAANQGYQHAKNKLAIVNAKIAAKK